jgi:hypothetical protein
VTADDLAPDSVGAAEIQDNAVGSSKIADGSVTSDDLAPNSVTSSEIVNGTVTADDLALDSVDASEIRTGAVGASEIADGSVGSAEIAASAVRGSELAAIIVVSVECNGGCNDSDLGEICGPGYEPIAVDCDIVDDDAGGAVPCGGNNTCFRNSMSTSSPLGSFCDAQPGFDAQVYCIETN